MSSQEFFEKALDSASQWVRFADPKAFGVFVFLGLGVNDLVGHANELFHGYQSGGVSGWGVTFVFILGLILAAATVVCVSFALFPRLMPRRQQSEGRPRSLLYFGGIAEFNDVEEYLSQVRSKTGDELEGEIARQAWEVSKIATMKHKWTQYSYVLVLSFLVSWAISRIGLSFL